MTAPWKRPFCSRSCSSPLANSSCRRYLQLRAFSSVVLCRYEVKGSNLLSYLSSYFRGLTGLFCSKRHLIDHGSSPCANSPSPRMFSLRFLNPTAVRTCPALRGRSLWRFVSESSHFLDPIAVRSAFGARARSDSP